MNIKEIYEHVFVVGFSIFGSIISLMFNRHEEYTLFAILRRLVIGAGVGINIYLFSFDYFTISDNARLGIVLVSSILADDILMTLLNLSAKLKDDPIGLFNQIRSCKVTTKKGDQNDS